MRIDPFTRTPGIAGAAFIDMHYADSIIYNFESSESSKYVYKIVGLRGSGKSVEYGKIVDYFSQKKKWLVYTLSAAGNPTQTLLAKLSREKFIDSNKYTTSITFDGSSEGNIAVLKGEAGIGYTKTFNYNDDFFSDEALLTEMIQNASEKGYSILIGVDDISKTSEMTKFLSIVGTLLLNPKTRLYFICTGLSKNIEDFAKEPSLTFFKRSDTAEIKPLDRFEVSTMYEKLLSIDRETAVKLSKFVKGYAYAYQVLGSLYFNKKDDEKLEDLIPEFDKIMSQDSYDLIWNSLTPTEKNVVKCIVKTNTELVRDVKNNMDNPNNFASIRDRLIKKHVVDVSERGYIRIELPRFKEYVLLWED